MTTMTGIIRRVDDLGRVVIPKEIRKKYNIREGDPLEIGLENDRIVLKKYEEYVDKSIIARESLKTCFERIDRLSPHFTVKDNTVTCELIINNQRVSGTAKCNSKDNFDMNIGMVIACCRALNIQPPYQLMEE